MTRVIVAATVFLLLGSVLPPLYNNQARPLPLDLNFTVTTEPATGPALNILRALHHEKPADSHGNPACESEQAPLYCYIEDRVTTLQRVTTTSATNDDAVASANSSLKVEADGKTIAEFNESSLLNRESAYPIPGLNSSQQFNITTLGTGASSMGFERDGISYFFPAKAEQRSYPYFDPMTQTAAPIDFTGTEKRETIPTYSFHQEIDPVSVVNSLSIAQQDNLEQLRRSGPAKAMFKPESLERFGLSPTEHVILEPFYTVKRDVWVEPTTGTILDVHEDIKIFLATDADQARQMVEENDTADRALFQADMSWSEATKQERLDSVRTTIESAKILSIVGWVGKVIGVVLLAYAASLYMRRHRDRA
ncbi:DUF3068 domain-containing protein [Corynebacterium striatum]|uniref:DUF3068 domain-containing protein n=1 Tax=Corynebacterium striatum TaxID=43770 RepID=UPI001FC86CE3|nr:DUF3068 domain-containing protein [Corynebacterium striatum]GKH18042.1 hypothetical protein CE91St29_23550 [Corynebacterium striatum]